MSQPLQSLFVADTNAPWIRSFLAAMPAGVKVRGLRIYNAFSFPGGAASLLRKSFRRERVSESWEDFWLPIPGWNRAFALSSSLVLAGLRRLAARAGTPEAVLFTLPWYAGVAERLPGSTKAYYAHDTFRFYGWDRGKTVALEGRLLSQCQVAFAVARRVQADLNEMAPTPVHYLPMAASWLPEELGSDGDAAAAAALASIPAPRVGCVGQISSLAYDWDLIGHLSETLPQAQFVFIGPKLRESHPDRRMAVVLGRPNVHWLGRREHSHLGAYLRRFDVCINPLAVTEHNHRRSPLRLFDYLTTDKPIVSTAIDEARGHEPFLRIAADRQEFRDLVAQALQGGPAPDLEQRWRHIRSNTWRERAQEFCAKLSAARDPAGRRPPPPQRLHALSA